MKKLACFGFMALVLGAYAQNDPPLNVWATAAAWCDESTPCQYGWCYYRSGNYDECVSGTQPSCTSSTCVLGPWTPTQCMEA